MAMWNDITDLAGRLRAEGEPFVIATVVAYKSPQSAKPGSKAIIKLDGSISGWIGGGCVQPIIVREAQKAMNTGKPKLVSISPEATHGDWKGVESYMMTCQGGGSLEIYLEPVLPKPDLLIVGNSPIAQILSGFGRMLDFKVCIADPEARQEQFPEADVVMTDLESMRSRIDSRSYVVVATLLRRATSNQPLEPVKGSKGASLPVMQKAVEPLMESVDPVCGMTVATANARYKTVFGENTFYFCCLRCKEAFEQSPQPYLEKLVV
jgi:xanthine/CO dehydrogenase XdhC/CoxF family maturation factor/YHS domain-containing protein